MAELKKFVSEDGMQVWAGPDYIGFASGYESSELSFKETLDLIAWLTRALRKGIRK